MDFDLNEQKAAPMDKKILAGGDLDFKRDDHSPAKLVDLAENTEKLQKKLSESGEDFEHVEHEPLLSFGKPVQEKDNKFDSAHLMDDFVGSTKSQYDSFKTDLGSDFAQFGTAVKETGSNVVSGIESKIDEKINQTKDFMAAERGFVDALKPKEPQQPQPQQQPPPPPEKKPNAPELFEDFELESNFTTAVNKLIKEDNEKFISSEDLLSDFKDERTRTPEPAKPQQKSELLINFPTQPAKEEIKPKEEEKVIKPAPVPPKAAEPKAPTPPTEKKPTLPSSSQSQKPMISAEEMFCRYGLDAWFKPERLHPQVESLIYWRDVKKSGIVFGTGLIVLLAISCFSVISVFAYLSLLALCGTIAFRIYKTVLGALQKTSEGHPFKEYLELDLTVSQEKAQQLVTVAVAHLNGFVSELRRLFLVEDLVDSLKFGVILWVLTYIGSWFNGMTLVILAFVALFTLPKVYENNKQSIDTYLDLVRSKFLEITDKVKAAVPIGKKPETDKDK